MNNRFWRISINMLISGSVTLFVSLMTGEKNVALLLCLYYCISNARTLDDLMEERDAGDK